MYSRNPIKLIFRFEEFHEEVEAQFDTVDSEIYIAGCVV